MDLLLWVTIGFIIIGFVVLITMKKGMESKLAFIKTSMEMEDEESSTKAKLIILWIRSAIAWGIVSMFLIAWCFHNHFG